MRCTALLLLAATLGATQIRVDRHPWTDAVEVLTPHYVVRTNTFPEIAESLSRKLENAYVLFQDRFGPLEGKAARRMRVALYRTRSEYLKLGDGVQGAIGHFDAARDRCAFAWRGALGEHGWPIAVHEACHHYFRRRYPKAVLPSWYSEGMACYFEGVQDETTTGHVSRFRVRAARLAYGAGDARLAHVLGARARVAGGRLSLTHYGPSRFYALAWSVVHFLAENRKYKAGFRRFELRLFHGRSKGIKDREKHARRILEEECGDVKRIEKDWLQHLDAMREPAAVRPAPVYAWELVSDKPYVRYAALRRLTGDELAKDLRPGARACLHDEDLVVRTAACRKMARRMDNNVARAMLAALDMGDPELKGIALKALAHPAAGVATKRLMRESEARNEAIFALTVIGDPRAYRTLRDALLDRTLPGATRARCAKVLGRDINAVSTLKVAADDPILMVRNAASASLLRLGRRREEAEKGHVLDCIKQLTRVVADDTNAVPVLVEILDDASAPERKKLRAVVLLGQARDGSAVPRLQRLCSSGASDRMRLEAVRALVKITGETRGYLPGQSVREREAVFRAWAVDG